MGLAAAGQLVLVASGSAGLHVLDLRHPDKPVKLSHYEMRGYARKVRVRGELAFVAAGRAVHLFRLAGGRLTFIATHRARGRVHELLPLKDRLVLAEGVEGVSVVDLSKPARPTLLGRFKVQHTARGLALVQGLLLVADGRKGVLTVDLKDPRQPREVYRYPAGRSVNAVCAAGRTVYAANDRDGLLILALDPWGRLIYKGVLPTVPLLLSK